MLVFVFVFVLVLVRVRVRATGQGEWPTWENESLAEPRLDHENLDVYRCSLEFLRLSLGAQRIAR